MVYWLCRPLMLLFYKLFYPVKVIGKENCIQKGRSLVVCNHLGKSDVLAVGALFKNKSWFLSKKEWFDKKFAAWLFDKLGAIPIDRDKPSLTSIKRSLAVLKDDRRLIMFPEGQRNFNDNSLLEVKQGAAMFAIKGKATITPVIIYEKLKAFKKNYVMVGKPIDLSKYYEVKYTDEVSAECTKIIDDALHTLQQDLFAYVENVKSKKSKKN